MSLHWKTISPQMRTLLDRFMGFPPLDSFYLVGGTALALRFGHRTSIDLDLFTHQSFEASRLLEDLQKTFSLSEVSVRENTVTGKTDGIKVDFMAHRYPLIANPEDQQDVRMVSLEDSAAMKLNAVANRGSKKDFWDICELLRHFSKEQLLGFYEQKYPHRNTWMVEKSLTYFEDADPEPDPIDLTGRIWQDIKTEILAHCRLD
ncbi:MAG: nucleotidyl transferase AbiEii/AbiGii toxin family protein [Opitutales bacterium]|nr:nucleotidyl transferase AbiEii/AbiGii toxin family protein [Opitutales bacterium]MCH8541701.1 nucleotidyl transferase AbiEii/AbiGii toxin family protein [Opitutales bacterium]